MARKHMIPLFIPHAGCPNACVFCDQKKITGLDTPVTPDLVQKELKAAASQAGEDYEIAFYGGSFTALAPETQESLLEAAQPFVRAGGIRVSTRPDAVDEAALQRLRRYGVGTVELGAQSMDDEVLLQSNRGHRAEDTRKAARMLKDHGFSLILQMMTGLPGDNGKASIETARQLIALEPDGVRIYPTVVLRDTELERQMREGTYRPQSIEEAVELCAKLYGLFLEADIPVIRLGLNPTELLSSGGAVAGAYHPAIGELVLSRMYLRKAQTLLAASGPLEHAALSVHPKRISVMVGQKRENLLALKRQFALKTIKVVPEETELWEITLKKL
jgi:histone acetyltransferase (RNA polymerase elongator complex component)